MSDWIPVKERLPNCEMNCLVSVDAHNFIGEFVTKARYVTDLTEWDKNESEHISGWIVITDNYEYYILDDVVAWMPFPKPYEEEK